MKINANQTVSFILGKVNHLSNQRENKSIEISLVVASERE